MKAFMDSRGTQHLQFFLWHILFVLLNLLFLGLVTFGTPRHFRVIKLRLAFVCQSIIFQ